MYKPQRARDTTIDELVMLLTKYKELILMTKYDGVRCLVKDNIVRGKSLLPIVNKNIQSLYGNSKYEGKDFEIIVTTNGIYDPVTCCRETVSYTNSEDTIVEHKCVLIDDINKRHYSFIDRLHELNVFANNNKGTFQLPDFIIISSIDQLLAYEEDILTKDNEAIIIRNPNLEYKEGVSSKEGELLRLKRHISEEAIIEDILPANTNNNEAKINLLGHSERSTAMAGLVQKDEVGKLLCRTVKDIHDPWSGRLIIKKDSLCIIATGAMTKEDKINIYRDREQYKGRMIKFKSFPKGTKNKPRFATFQYFVPEFDNPIKGN
jgi:DNA ligase-1